MEDVAGSDELLAASSTLTCFIWQRRVSTKHVVRQDADASLRSAGRFSGRWGGGVNTPTHQGVSTSPFSPW